MKNIIFLLIFAIFCAANEITIATYNTQNLFDDKIDGSEYKSFKKNWGKEDYQKKIAQISNQILAINADIIALEEIENRGVLKKLAKNTNYEYFNFTKPKNSPVGLGILSKKRILSSKIYKVKGVKTRNILRADFDEFSIFVNHFPAYKNLAKFRQKAADTLLEAINDTKKNGISNIILLGDFNSRLNDKNFLLNNIISLENFTNLWKFVPQKDRISHISGGAIDHILLSSHFFDKNSAYKFKKFYRCNDAKVSDHFALCLVISTKSNQNKIQPTTLTKLRQNGASSEIFLIKKAVVIYKDKLGYVISQNRGDSVFVFDKGANFALGTQMDAKVFKSQIYHSNFEITGLEVEKIYDEKVEISAYKIKANDLNLALSGNVIDKISGKINGDILQTKFGDVRVFSRSKSSILGTYTDALVWFYKEKRQIIVK